MTTLAPPTLATTPALATAPAHAAFPLVATAPSLAAAPALAAAPDRVTTLAPPTLATTLAHNAAAPALATAPAHAAFPLVATAPTLAAAPALAAFPLVATAPSLAAAPALAALQGADTVQGSAAVRELEPSEGSAPSPRWQDDPVWNDGQAEVGVYRGTEIKYGNPREFTAYFVVVAEDLRNDSLVKSDEAHPPGGLTRVLKINQVYDIRTGIYAYRQMASVFLRISDLAPVKESVTSHEWCGNAFMLLENREGKGTYRGFSYFDGEAEVSRSLDLTGATLYDGLPVALRALPFKKAYSQRIRLVSQLLGSHLSPVKLEEASVTVTGEETVSTAMGALGAWTVEVGHSGGTDRFWIERAAPNRLLRWDQYDGGRYRLEKTSRLAYWTLHGPGDEKVLMENAPDRK